MSLTASLNINSQHFARWHRQVDGYQDCLERCVNLERTEYAL